MSVVLCVNLISRRRSHRNTAGAAPPPSSLQLVPVTRIEKFVANGGRTRNDELKKTDEPESDGTFVMKHRRFTNTALPVFSGAECWFQHFHIVQAIVKSNGWPEETAALLLFPHLKGEALNVALLLTREKRESWTGLVSGLSAYYQSPRQIGGAEKVVRERVSPTGIGPGYVRN